MDDAALGCDVLEFEQAIATGRHERALALYRGPFLDGVHVEGAGEELEDWIGAERRRLRDAAVHAASAASEHAQARGDADGALEAARIATALVPDDESAARRVIELLLRAGNRGSALRAYEEIADRLLADFGVEPSPATQALRERPGHATEVREARGPASQHRFPGAIATSALRPRVRWRQRVVLSFSLAPVIAVGGAIAFMLASRPSVTIAATTASGAPSAEWQAISPMIQGPPGRFGSRAVLDSTGDAMLVLGGIEDVARKRIASLGQGYWRLRGFGTGGGASWSRIAVAPGPHPAPRWIFGLSSVAALDRLVLHGGALGLSSPCASDTWVLDHASGIGALPRWRLVRTRGATPPPRGSFDQVFDARRNRLIVFAGNDCFYPNFEDTWVLGFDDSSMSTGVWSVLDPDRSAGIPLRRDGYMAAYDTAQGRLLVFGGRAAALPTDELWSLEHAAGTDGTPSWHPIRCAGAAPVVVGAASAYDARSDTWTFFGGAERNAQFGRSVWRVQGASRDLPHCAWERVTTSEPGPAARGGASAATLPGGRGIAVFGGEFQNVALADAWILRQAPPE